MNSVKCFLAMLVSLLLTLIMQGYAQDETQSLLMEKTYFIYDNCQELNGKFIYKGTYKPWGWMPDGSGIAIQESCQTQPHSGKTSIRFEADVKEKSWVGAYFLAHDGENWGNTPGVNLFETLGIKKGDQVKVIWWAKGEKGDEYIEFKVGGMGSGSYPDTITMPISTGYIRLTKEWKQYELDITGKDLTNIVGGFCFVTCRSRNYGKNTVVFYLDDIMYKAQITK